MVSEGCESRHHRNNDLLCTNFLRQTTDYRSKKQIFTPFIPYRRPLSTYLPTFDHTFTHTTTPRSLQMDDSELAAEVKQQDFMDALLTVVRRLDGGAWV